MIAPYITFFHRLVIQQGKSHFLYPVINIDRAGDSPRSHRLVGIGDLTLPNKIPLTTLSTYFTPTPPFGGDLTSPNTRPLTTLSTCFHRPTRSPRTQIASVPDRKPNTTLVMFDLLGINSTFPFPKETKTFPKRIQLFLVAKSSILAAYNPFI